MSSGPVRKYLIDNENQDVRQVILKHKELLGIPTSQLFEQIAARRKAKDKLPLYYHTDGVIYPPQHNLEQSSSQLTASFKSDIAASVLKARPVIADLTGGFGVDTYFFSTNAASVHYVETDESLAQLAQHSHRLLGATNIEYHHQKAEDFLATFGASLDLIYVDPSRKSEQKKKIVLLQESFPDIVSLASKVFAKSTWLLVKASPLLDIQAGMAELPHIRKVFVVSVKNECKEVLLLCEKDFAGVPVIEAVNLQSAANVETFQFTFPEERASEVVLSEPLKYLYEPNASILKAGAFKSIASRFLLKKLHPNTHLYTSDTLVDKFPGRKFAIEDFVKPDRALLRKFFADGKANVTTRNYPLSAEALKKKSGLMDGGDKFLIGFSGRRKKYLVVARRL